MMVVSDSQQLEDDAIAQARQGSAAGFEYLYHRHQRRVYRLCLRMTGNAADAEELTQETFLLLFRKIGTFRGAAAFSTWLHRLTVNVVLTRLRRKRLPQTPLEDFPKGLPEDGWGRPIAAPGGGTNILERIRLQRALDELEPRGRKVVVMHDLAGYQHREIAAAMGHSESSSKVYLHRAHEKLRGLLQPPSRNTARDEPVRRQRDTARRALRQTQARLCALLDNPTYGMAHCDGEGRLLEGNLTLAAMLGCASPSELEAAADCGPAPRPPWLAPSPSGRIAPVEMAWRRKDGSTVPVRCSGHEVRDAGRRAAGYQVVVEDLTQQHAQLALLRQSAGTDALTGLTNYGRLLEVLERELDGSRRTGRKLAVLLLDLDGLKRINDALGHLAGNRALVRVARTLAACCRAQDTPARFGGDEFAVVAPDTGAHAAGGLARRIRSCCAAGPELPPLALSVGVATYPADGAHTAALLAAADRVLYRAKSHAQLVT